MSLQNARDFLSGKKNLEIFIKVQNTDRKMSKFARKIRHDGQPSDERFSERAQKLGSTSERYMKLNLIANFC